MKNRKTFFAIMLSLIIFMGGCDQEEFLEEPNPREVATDNYWTSLEHANAGIITIYTTLLNHYILNIQPEAMRSDMGYPGWNRPSPSGDMVVWYNQAYTNSDPYVERKWEASYEGIFRANQVIEGLEKMQETVEDTERWESLMAEAKFFRGLFHFYLHSSFNHGEIIIRDFVPKAVEDFNLPISSSEVVIEFFREDLKFAYEHLPSKWNENKDLGRVTAGTAATILGTSHLYEEEFTQAMGYFQDVLTNSDYGYRLETDPGLLFTNAGEFNDESIFEIAYNLDHKPELGQWNEESMSNRLARSGPGQFGGGRSILPVAWIAHEYQNEPLDSKDPRNWVSDGEGGIRLRSVSLRASSMIALVEDDHSMYYLNGTTQQQAPFTHFEFGYYKKYTNHDVVATELDLPYGPWRSGKNVTVNRLAEVYLMHAECLIKTGDIDGALDAINTVRKRWGLKLLGPERDIQNEYDLIVYDAESLMEHLMFVEKPLELSIEGHGTRWIDMRRWGITADRFQQLSEEEYYVEDFSYVNQEGQTRTKNMSYLVKGAKPDDSNSIAIRDYEIAAQNYRDEVNAYLPIPLGEILTNPNLFSNK
jgi:hypothetical protein